MPAKGFGGNSMTGELLRVVVCPPVHAGWNQASHDWKTLGFGHIPNFELSQLQHRKLCQVLQEAGAELICLPASEDLSLDAVYAHDASLSSDHGCVLMHPGKANRVAEAKKHEKLYTSLGIPILGSAVSPGCSEAGDIVWLDRSTLLVGCGYRTNAEGIRQLREMFHPYGVEVISAPLPYGPGPSACLHLMSLMSMLDEKTILVDLPWLAVETVELLRARGFRFIQIEDSERETLACNVLSIGKNRLVAIEENVLTNRKLRDAGFEVRTFAGSEICINGSGGPTCLTRPILRG